MSDCIKGCGVGFDALHSCLNVRNYLVPACKNYNIFRAECDSPYTIAYHIKIHKFACFRYSIASREKKIGQQSLSAAFQ
jgi:hypothetical protein